MSDPTMTTSLDDGSHALVRRIHLEVTSGPDRGKTFASSGDRTVVGTHASADFVLTDPTISRYHCALVLRGNRVEIEDLESRNGTKVDGIAIALGWVDRDATLQLGTTSLRFRLGDELNEVALSSHDRFGEMVGSSRAMRAVFAACERAAGSDSTVLLQGETGTGKDAAAISLHMESPRRDKQFVVVDCGSIPPGLIEGQLFGHEKGAFTGATSLHRGFFEVADGGTILLDEIGELPIELQPKLLRVLEARTVRRVGGNVDIPIDVRVIAATNRDLQRDVNARRFRADLYYRLAVVEIRMPPLRARPDDLPMLVDALLSSIGATGPAADRLRSREAIAKMQTHAWPGNIRELRNHLERSLAFDEPAPMPERGAASMPVIDPKLPLRTARDRWLGYFERSYLTALLEEHGGNVTRAARAAGIARAHFYRLLSRTGLTEQSADRR